MEERKIRELNYKVQMVTVKLMSERRSGVPAYTDIFEKIAQNKISTAVYGPRHMILRTQFKDVVSVNGREWNVIYGSLSTFTVFDNEDDWINLENLEVENVNLPANLFPGLKETDYFFVPEAHRFAFVAKSGFSINNVEKFLNFAVGKVVEEGEDYSVSKEQSDEDFEHIYQAQEVKRLIVDFSYSNQDIGDEAFEFMTSQVNEAHLKRLRMEGTPDNTGNINVNVKILKGALELAKHYGKATASVVNNGIRSQINTEMHPKTIALKCKETLLRMNVVKEVVNLFRSTGNGQ